MRRLGAILFVATVGACSDPGGEFLEELRELDYRGFARAPGWETPRLPDQGGPHGAFLDLYVNDVVDDSVAAGEPLEAWPEGALIVKDAWNDEAGTDLQFIAAMEKREGQWFWAEYRSNDAVVVEAIEDPRCTRCHDAGADGVLAFDLP